MKKEVKKVLFPVLIFILFLIIWMIFLSSIALKKSSVEFNYPKISNPAIISPSQSLNVEVESEDCDNISFKIRAEEEFDLEEQHKEKLGELCLFELEIPKETSEGLYDLILNYKNLKKVEQNSVSIKKEISDSFTFIQMTDLHLGDPRGFFENPKEVIFNGGLNKIISEINSQNPDFVIITGDLTFGQLYPFEYYFEYKKLKKHLEKFEVPIYLIPGNHDLYIQSGQDGAKFWQKNFGTPYYSFVYNETLFLNLNSYDWPNKDRNSFSLLAYNWGGYLSDTQLIWIENILKNSKESQKIITIHHNPLLETNKESLRNQYYYNREKIISLMEKYGVEFVFAGHTHRNNLQFINETTYLTTTSSLSSTGKNEKWGYRLIEVENNTVTEDSYNTINSIPFTL